MVKDKLSVELSKAIVNCSTGFSSFSIGTLMFITSYRGSRIDSIASLTPQGYCLELKITSQRSDPGTVQTVYFPAAK